MPFAATLPSVGNLAFSPDARTLVTGDFDGQGLRLWEIATGKERWQFRGHTTGISSVVWSSDGALLASSSNDAPAFVWNVYGKQVGERLPSNPWTAEQSEKQWKKLCGPDARVAFEAIRDLIRNSDSAIPLLRTRLKPAEPLDPKRLKQWLQDLDGDAFEARQAAFAELGRLGDRIEAPLRQALKERPSLEAQRRLEGLLENLDTVSPEHLARWRSLEALEQMSTTEAVQLLEELSAGQPGARLTEEASAVLVRVRQAKRN
jgi:hypothetical protein